MKLKEVLEKSIGFFKQKKFHSPRLDAELIISHALSCNRMDLYLKYDQPLTEVEVQKCREVVRRRSLGEPVAYICGQRDFFGLTFKVNRDVLIPRPETEHIIERIDEWIENRIQISPDAAQILNILDLGTGSGCLAIVLAKKYANARVLAIDISANAIQVAKENAEINGVLDRITFLEVDASDKFKTSEAISNFIGQKLDIIVSNPPYIAVGDNRLEENVKKFEPNEALFAGRNGLHFLLEWSKNYVDHLNENSICLFEFGVGQSSELRKHFEELGIFSSIEIIKDLSGHDRIICGVKNG